MKKLVSSGKSAMDKIKEGVDLVVNPVKSTISPNGRTVIISESYVADYDVKNSPIKVTKDGYLVSTKISSNDPEVQVGVLFAQQAAEKQMIDAGDATSTCCLFVQGLLDGGLKLIEEGVSPVNVKEGINKGVEEVVKQLKAMAIPVNGDIEIIRKVATTSANNDKEIGDLIASAYEKIGDDGVIKIEKAKGMNTSIKITGGVTFGKGWASEHFVNAPKGECILAKPYILIVDEHLVQMKEVMPLLEKIFTTNGINNEKRGLMIFCNRSDGEALATFIVNHKKDILPCCVVQMDFLGEKKVEFMQDIALATGGFFISENTGGKLDEIGVEHLGSAESVVISRDETTIIGGDKKADEFEKLLSVLKKQEEAEEDADLKELLRKRIARLNSSVAVLSVGGVTEVEMEEKLDRVDDSTRAVKCALEEGYLPGGATSFLRVHGVPDFATASSILLPFGQICVNGGKNYTELLTEVLDNENINFGYNAVSDKVENLIESGVIEPVKSNRCALQNAASVVNQILSSQFMITDSL